MYQSIVGYISDLETGLVSAFMNCLGNFQSMTHQWKFCKMELAKISALSWIV